MSKLLYSVKQVKGGTVKHETDSLEFARSAIEGRPDLYIHYNQPALENYLAEKVAEQDNEMGAQQ